MILQYTYISRLCVYACIYSCMCMFVHDFSNYMVARMYVYVRACVRACMRACVRVRVCMCLIAILRLCPRAYSRRPFLSAYVCGKAIWDEVCHEK